MSWFRMLSGWPPAVTVKKHPRAKHVKLRATAKKGLELTVPLRFSLKEVPFILDQHRAWIEKQLQQLTQAKPLEEMELPHTIELRCLQQQWQIHYQQNSGKLKIITRPHQACVVSGNIENKILCKKLLVKWVRTLASKYLLELLKQISQEIQLPYSTATVRDQSSRWGSCSSKKSISLNYKLIFMPYELTRHIIIHELCHTKVLNHSEKFWKLVAKFDDNWEQHRISMRKANPYIPAWVEDISV